MILMHVRHQNADVAAIYGVFRDDGIDRDYFGIVWHNLETGGKFEVREKRRGARRFFMRALHRLSKANGLAEVTIGGKQGVALAQIQINDKYFFIFIIVYIMTCSTLF